MLLRVDSRYVITLIPRIYSVAELLTNRQYTANDVIKYKLVTLIKKEHIVLAYIRNFTINKIRKI